MKLQDLFKSLETDDTETKREKMRALFKAWRRKQSLENPGDGETPEQSPGRGLPGRRVGADGPGSIGT